MSAFKVFTSRTNVFRGTVYAVSEVEAVKAAVIMGVVNAIVKKA